MPASWYRRSRENRKQVEDHGRDSAFRRAAGKRVGAHLEVLQNRKGSEYLTAFRHVSDAEMRRARAAHREQSLAIEGDRAGVRLDGAGDRLEQGGFAGPVGADHGDKLPAPTSSDTPRARAARRSRRK